MEQTYHINIHIMGDLQPQMAKVKQVEKHFHIEMPYQHEVVVTFSPNLELVQTEGTPLDSNTLHSISEALKAKLLH